MLSKLPEVTQQVTVSGFFWDPVPSGNSTEFPGLPVLCPGKLFPGSAVAQGPQGFVFKGEMKREVFLTTGRLAPASLPHASCPGKAGFTAAFATHGKQQTPKIEIPSSGMEKIGSWLKCLF